MRTVCTGWLTLHSDVKVLADDKKGGLDTHGICHDCLEVFTLHVAEQAELRAKVPS